MFLAHSQDCTVETANVEASVIYRTLSLEAKAADVRRAAIDGAVAREGGTVRWRTSEPAGRSYALLELPDGDDAGAIGEACGGAAYDRAVIALAVFPAAAQALPSLLDALGGPGRPAGVLACRPCAGGVVVEWDPARTGAGLVLGLIDVELRRFGGVRTIEVLSPLPAELVARIAAEGLAAPQIEPNKILELRLDRA
jgi:hypothetical protein